MPLPRCSRLHASRSPTGALTATRSAPIWQGAASPPASHPKTNRRRPIPHDKARYRIAIRYERFANIALRAIIPGAIAIRCLRE
jgi:hypothetical protein